MEMSAPVFCYSTVNKNPCKLMSHLRRNAKLSFSIQYPALPRNADLAVTEECGRNHVASKLTQTKAHRVPLSHMPARRWKS